MRNKQAVTLVELVIAMSLLALMAATTTISFVSIKSLRQNFLNREESFAQANLAAAAIFERALRTGGSVGTEPFTIPMADAGRKVLLRRVTSGGSTITETIWFENATNKVKYQIGAEAEKVLLNDVSYLMFVNDVEGRLAYELTMQDGQRIRTSVQPRNQRTPKAIIN